MRHIAYQHFRLALDPWPVHQATADAGRVAMTVKAAVATGAMVAIVGARGSGKTHALWETLDAMCDCTIITPLRLDRERLLVGDILGAVVTQISNELPRHSAEARTGQARRLLRAARRPVLVIDEAHALHSATVRSLKRLRELVGGGGRRRPMLPVVLVGQSDPTARVAEVGLRTDTVHLSGLTREEAGLALEGLGGALDAGARQAVTATNQAFNWLELRRLVDDCLTVAMAGGEPVTQATVRQVLGGERRTEGRGAQMVPMPVPGAVAAALAHRAAA